MSFFGPLPPTDFCRLDSTYGHTLERQCPHPHRIVAPLAELVVLLRWRRARLRGGRAFRSEPEKSRLRRNLRPPARLATGSPRLRGETRDSSGPTEASEGPAHCVGAPPRFPAEHPLSPSRCCERFGASSAAPHAAAPFESKWCLASRGGLGPRSGVSREGGRFSENQNAFRRFVLLVVREDHSLRPFGLGLQRHAALACVSFESARQISLHQSGIATRSTSACVSAPRAPKP